MAHPAAGGVGRDALGYYEFASGDTGPYIYIRNAAAHDLLPFTVSP